MSFEFAAITYRTIRDRIRAEDLKSMSKTLVDTVEGLTDVHEVLEAVVRAAGRRGLTAGLKGRIADMQERLDRLQDRASKRRQIAKDVMIELNLKPNGRPRFYRHYPGDGDALTGCPERKGSRTLNLLGAGRTSPQASGVIARSSNRRTNFRVTLSNPEPILSVRVR